MYKFLGLEPELKQLTKLIKGDRCIRFH